MTTIPGLVDVIDSATEPTLDENCMAYWWDTANSKMYHMVRRGGVQHKIEVAITRYEETFTDQTSVTVDHNLGYKPHVTVLDGTNSVIIPDSIVHNTDNQLTITFSVATSGTIICSV